MNMDTSARAMSIQSHVKACELEEIASNDFRNKNKQWSNTPSAPYTTSFGEGLIVAVYARRHLYRVARIGQQKFQVFFNEEDHPGMSEIDSSVDFKDVPMPMFRRRRIVRIAEDGTMYCDCCRFECTGMFCVHQVAVADHVCQAKTDEDFEGFTHNDIALRYRSDYMHLAFKDSTPAKIQQLFNRLALLDKKGPRFQGKIPDCIEIQAEEEKEHALDRLKN